MNDSNKEQAAVNTDRAKSIEAIQAMKSGESLRPTAPAARRKRWPSLSLIALMLLLAIPVIIYLLQSEPLTGLEGLGVAFCAVACGVLLVRHFIHLLAEEDTLQEQQFDANQGTVSPPEPNPAGLQTNPTKPPPEAGKNFK